MEAYAWEPSPGLVATRTLKNCNVHQFLSLFDAAFFLPTATIKISYYAWEPARSPNQITCFPQCLTIEPHVVRKGCESQLKIATFT